MDARQGLPISGCQVSRQSNSLIYKEFNYRKTTEPISTIFGPQIETTPGHILLENGVNSM